MARHLYIAGVDRWPPANDIISIEQALTYEIDTCSFQVAGIQPGEGDEVIIEDDGIGRLFAGVIVTVELVDKDLKIWKVECNDYTALLDRKLAVETYELKTADWIFRDIVSKYCPGFTANGVQGGAPTVEYLAFDYKPPSECFKNLCEYIGWHWQPDYHKDLHFFSVDNLASPAPLVLIPGGMFRLIRHTIDTQGLRNRIYVRGGTMLSDPQTIQWKADGVARTWVLPWSPNEASLTVGEAAKTVGIENVGDDADYNYMLNFEKKYIRCSKQTTAPAAGTTMSLTAKQDIDVITMFDDMDSQAAIAAVQGGDGVYEHVITDDTLVTVQAAEAAGMADLREHANPKVTGSFETEVDGWAPGQLAEISLPDRGIEGTFLVQRVTITPFDSEIWTYTVEYGGRLLGIADFLAALVSAQQQKRQANSLFLHKYVSGQETVGVSDELTTTPRSLPYVCGDPDAICGLVVAGEAPVPEVATFFLTPNFPAKF